MAELPGTLGGAVRPREYVNTWGLAKENEAEVSSSRALGLRWRREAGGEGIGDGEHDSIREHSVIAITVYKRADSDTRPV